jgi:hypothetical protein
MSSAWSLTVYNETWRSKPFHIITICFHAWKWHIRKILSTLYTTSCPNHIWCTHHKKMCMDTADESSRPTNLSTRLSENELVSMLGV